MPKHFNSPFLAPWVNERLNLVLGADAEVQRLNGTSGFAIDMFGEPVQGLRTGYGRGGMPPPAQVGHATGALGRNFQDMREIGWKGGDKYFHCKGQCQASSAGPYGAHVSERLGNLREVLDQRLKGYPLEDVLADQEANITGREAGVAGQDCRSSCQMKRPKGLPERY